MKEPGGLTCKREAARSSQLPARRTYLLHGLRSLPRSPWPLRSLVGWAGKQRLSPWQPGQLSPRGQLSLPWPPLPPPRPWPAAERASPGRPAAVSAPRRASQRRSGRATLWGGHQTRCHPVDKTEGPALVLVAPGTGIPPSRRGGCRTHVRTQWHAGTVEEASVQGEQWRPTGWSGCPRGRPNIW